MSWGIFQPVYLDQVYPGQTNAFQIAFVGTIGHALTSSLGIPLSFVINTIGHRNTLAIGTVLCPLGLFLASIATELWQTFLTHGFIFGLGASFCFSASFMLPSQWFVRRRALANGVANTGSAFGSLCFSPLSQYLIETLGYRNALRVLGAILFGLFALATVLVRVRYPPSSSNKQRDSNYGSISTHASSPLFSIPFALCMAFSLLAPFGYIIPFHFMPTYATVELGSSSSVASLMVSVGMAANIVCRIALGFIGDRLGQINTLFIATFVSAVFTMTMWENAHTIATYAVYCALIGLISGAYFGLIPSVLARIVGMKQYLYISGSMAWMFMAIGTLLGTPFFGRLAEISWTCAIQFAGGTSLAAAACMFTIRILLDRKLLSKI
ncbi:MFS general substrate transporter [Lichtheimia hyalospora FSU 10163]|nr:MFS general substrate transporter [Lichtheimia hyalospora FSU 10163]